MCAVRPKAPKKKDDLSAEPTLYEALADPVVQAVMARDRLSREHVLQVALAARAKLLEKEPVLSSTGGQWLNDSWRRSGTFA